LSKTDHILGHKASLKKYKKIEITSYILSLHNGILVEINKKRNYSNVQRLKNSLLNDQWAIKEIR
jgi:asparagine synthetase A